MNKKNVIHVPKVKKVRTGTETFSHISPKIFDSPPENIKESDKLYPFKEKIKAWICRNCPFSIFRTCVAEVRYLD